MLETERLHLRPVAVADVPTLHALLAEPDVRRFLCDGRALSEAEVLALVTASAESFRRDGAGLFLATLRERDLIRGSEEPGADVGIAGFRRADEVGGLELICALRRRYWRMGLAAEACRACLAHAFGTAGLRQVFAGADGPNASSLRLIERLGFRPFLETPGAFGVIRWFEKRELE